MHLYTNLIEFYCNDNNITQCDNLPITLKIFNCSDNEFITKIDNLYNKKYNMM